MKAKHLNLILKLVGLILILTCTFLAIANDVRAQNTPTDTLTTCAGLKADKTPCKSTFIVKGTKYCTAHNPNAIKCAGKNSKGLPCGMTVKEKGEYCRYHQPKK